MKYFTTHESEKSAKAMVLMLKTNTTKNVVDYEIRPKANGKYDLYIEEGLTKKVLTDTEREKIKEIVFRWIDAQLELDAMNITITDWYVKGGKREAEIENENGDKEWIFF